MKKYFAIIALASLTLVACEKVQEFFDDSNDVTTIYAIAGADRTKTTVSGLNVYWSDGDVVAVANEDGNMVEFELKSGAGSAEASFEGTLGGKELGTYAVYPATSNSAVAGNTVTVDYLESWEYSQTILPMWGKRVSQYSFYNVGGAVLVTYSNVPTTANNKKFVFTSNKNITGPVTVSSLDSTPSVDASSMTGSTVTITGISGSETSVSVIVPVPAGSGYNITAQLKDASTNAVVPGTYKAATGRTFSLNRITKFEEVDLTPVISVSSANPMAVVSTASSQTITYAIANVAATEVVSASTTTSWISNVTVVDGTTVTFDVAQQPAGGDTRSGEITLSYSGADDVIVTVNQDPAPVINLSTTTPLYVKETGEDSQSVSYTISYPTAGSELTAAESLDWVSTPSVGAAEVTFTVSDQTHGTSNARYGIITLNYPNANPVSFYVSQEGKVYTLDGTDDSAGNSGYTAADLSQNGITWNVEANTTTNPWRLGGNKKFEGTRTLYSKTPIPYNVTSIEVTTGNSSNLQGTPSLAISAYNDNAFNSVLQETSSTSLSETVTLNKSNETSWKNKYYKIVYSIHCSQGQAGYIQFTNAVFYGYIVDFS